MMLATNWLIKKHRELENMFLHMPRHRPEQSTPGEHQIVGLYASVQDAIAMELERRKPPVATEVAPPRSFDVGPCDRCSAPTEIIPRSPVTLCEDCVFNEAHEI